MKPYQSGGDMILSVSFEKTIYNDVPYKFEAGTPNIADAIGMGAAVDYLQAVGMERIAAYEQSLLAYGLEKLGAVDGLRFIGAAENRAGVISFVLDGIHPADLGDDSRSPGGGRAHRPSLRRAGDAFLQGAGDRESVAGFL